MKIQYRIVGTSWEKGALNTITAYHSHALALHSYVAKNMAGGICSEKLK